VLTAKMNIAGVFCRPDGPSLPPASYTAAFASRGLSGSWGKVDLSEAGLFVNRAAVGMYPNGDPVLLAEAAMVVFQSGGSGFWSSSSPHLVISGGGGCLTFSGCNRPVRQGVQAFRLWTGMEAPAKVMEQALLQALGEKPPGTD
jgi:shikimate dehydrogenase